MNYLDQVLSPPKQAAGSILDPRFWASDESQTSAAGLEITPDNAMRNRAVFRCVSLLGGIAKYLPLFIYRRLERGKERATNHPLSGLFTLGPNRWMTAGGWFELVVHHLLLRGNSYHEVISGPRGVVDQLIPLHPARIVVEVNNQDGLGWVDGRTGTMTAQGRIRYVETQRMGARRILTEEQVFHIRGLSANGVVGLSAVALMKDTLGLAMATQLYGSRFFSKNAMPRGVFKTPNKLSPEGYARLQASIAAEEGVNKSWKVKILEEGAEWQAIGMSNEDSQFLETRDATDVEIAGWFGVPPHLIGAVNKTTSWGSGIAEQNLALLTYTVAPILECIEQSIDKELIVADQTYFAEFLVDAMLRVDPLAAANADNIRINNGTLSPDESRARNNQNPREDGQGHRFLRPLNMQYADEPAEVSVPAVTDEDVSGVAQEKERATVAAIKVSGATALIRAGFDPDASRDVMALPPIEHLGLLPITLKTGDATDPAPEFRPEDEDVPREAEASNVGGRAAEIVKGAAAQIVRKEINWVRAWAPRLAKNPAAWREKVEEFYAKHADLVEDRLALAPYVAVTYCARQRDALLSEGVAVLEEWKADDGAGLAALALGKDEAV